MMWRLADVSFAAAGLCVLMPLLLGVSLLLWVTGERKVIFRQRRVGRYGRPFTIYKFVTMLENSAFMDNGLITIRNDPRVLPVGRILRAMKINELPQLVNILRGDMSVIGPRPTTQDYIDVLSDEARIAFLRLRPGLSSYASLLFADEEIILSAAENRDAFDKQVVFPYKIRIERWAHERAGLLFYLRVLAMTFLHFAGVDTKKRIMALSGFPPPPSELADYMRP